MTGQVTESAALIELVGVAMSVTPDGSGAAASRTSGATPRVFR
jgi:hypothetical protein